MRLRSEDINNPQQRKSSKQKLASGSLVFRERVASRVVKQVMRGELKQRVDSSAWKMGRGKFNQIQAFRALQLAQSCSAEILKLYGNNRKSILMELKDVKFPNLKLLNLCKLLTNEDGNNIVSLQCIQELDAPLLEDLFLGNNKINTLASMRKMNLPRLRILGYQMNRIKESQCLIQMHAPQLINLESQMVAHRDKAQGQASLNWIVRLESNILQTLKFDGADRINGTKSYLRVHKKYDFLAWDFEDL